MKWNGRKLGEAEALFRQALDMRRRLHPEPDTERADVLTGVHRYYGAFLARAGRCAAAEAELLAAEKALREHRGGAQRTRTAVLEALVDLRSAWDAAAPGQGHGARAAEWESELQR